MVRQEKNLLPTIYFDKLKNIVTSNSLQWYFQKQTIVDHKSDNHFMFTHSLLAFNQG